MLILDQNKYMTNIWPKFWPLGSFWMLTSERLPLHNSITCTSECAVYKVFFVCSWFVVGLLLFLLCHLRAVSLLSALVSFSSVSPPEKKSILYVSCGIRLLPTSYTPSGAPSREGADGFCLAWLDSYSSSLCSTAHF